MKIQIHKNFLSFMLAAAIAVTGFSICSVKATAYSATENLAVEQHANIVYKGYNNQCQDYYMHGHSIDSYLTICPDGSLMRVQNAESIDGVLVEYYDASYNLVSSRIIPKELPIFGGFYATDDYYFLLTGQENPEESKDVTVYRVTRYDKDWVKNGSRGLKNCNTTIPFRSGTTRMTTVGDYLLIRTSHQMYKSSDGKNHQANATMQLNMKTMRFTDSLNKVSNRKLGYVSHSFNQFIQVENNRIVALDHGDAYPRSIVLIEYPDDITDGKFVPSQKSCTLTDVLAFPGETGENRTGATVGGFEISNSSYLVAGNSVVQDENNISRRTRNIFVASVDKRTHAVTMNWLTNYAEGEETTFTPHMVKINDGQYLMLWSRNKPAKVIYYTMLDSTGKQLSNIYEMHGDLSDCVPIIKDNKLVWYTWYYNGEIIFNEINLNDLSQTNAINIKNGEKVETEYTITFDAGGGNVIGDTSMTTIGQHLPVLPSASKSGNIFDGWYTALDGGKKITDTTSFDADNTVYAHWTANEVTQGPDAEPDAEVHLDKVSLVRVKSSSKGKMTVIWKAGTLGEGYEISYSTNKNFPSAKTFIKKADIQDSSKTISKLSKGKVYYVKIRAYQESDGEKHYGEWSSIKKVKIKK